ncbi:MAG: hypothetical protein H7125_16075, partial [Proteobacteria bacterium]|nr:hypothetical protein [Burkholderiales bacterium]
MPPTSDADCSAGADTAEYRLPAWPIARVVRAQGSAFERVRAAGDWSDAEFKRGVGPLLLAFAQHVHLLPLAPGDAPGS